MRKQWYFLAALATALILAAAMLIATSWRNLLITWHTRQRESAASRWKQDLQGTPEMQEVSRQEDLHRDELVRLGALVRRDYVFENLTAPRDYRLTLLKIMARQRVGLKGAWSSPVAYSPAPLRVTVWCAPQDQPAWDKFIEALDQPPPNLSDE